MGEKLTLTASDGHSLGAYRADPEGSPRGGVVVLQEIFGVNAHIRDVCDRFAADGYVALAPALGPDASLDDVAGAADALRAMREHDGKIAALGHGEGGTLACRAAAAAGFDAVAAYDATGLAEDPGSLTDIPCPKVLLFGTQGSTGAANAAERLREALDRKDGSGIFTYDDAAPDFAIPSRPGFDKRVDSLAHSRVLEVFRRVMGPYYDFVALFDEHVRHEFETRDVDATMATMIDEPYVNHAATLAGGVGHDMLKRFYKAVNIVVDIASVMKTMEIF